MNMIIRMTIGGVIGGLAGFLFYRFVGCSSGMCPMWSNPWSSSVVGAVVGVLLSRPF